MGILEQIRQMQNQRIPDEEIVSKLREQGVSPREINDAINQSQIKKAVVDDGEMNFPPQQTQENYIPQTQEIPEYSPEGESTQQQEYIQPQEGYQQDQYGYSPGGIDSDTIIELAEQVFFEKTKKIQKQVEDLNEFKTLSETKIENISDRLKRIETTIDKLQIAILEKIGSYGENINSIKKEMSMMQDSFGKVVNQAITNSKSLNKEKKNSKK
jgi:hypothetical protein